MSEGIPAHIDLLRAARSGSQFEGPVRLGHMKRLVGMLASDQGQIHLLVSLAEDGQGYAKLHGSAKGQVEVFCQRCLQPIPLELGAEFDLTLVESEHEAEQVPDERDVLVVTEVPGSLVNIVEDELILALPLVQMHEQDECEATAFMQDERSVPEETEAPAKENPFEVLKDLKIDG